MATIKKTTAVVKTVLIPASNNFLKLSSLVIKNPANKAYNTAAQPDSAGVKMPDTMPPTMMAGRSATGNALAIMRTIFLKLYVSVLRLKDEIRLEVRRINIIPKPSITPGIIPARNNAPTDTLPATMA